MEAQIEPEIKEEPQPEPQTLVKTQFKFRGSIDFKKILKLFQDLIGDEIEFQSTMQGIRVCQMEPSRVAMTELIFPKEVFEEFHCVEEGKFVLDVDRLIARVFKNVYKREDVEFIFNNGKAHVTMNAEFKRNFDVHLLQPLDEETPKPKLSPRAQVKLVTKIVRDIMKDVEDHVMITATSEGIRFDAGGEDMLEPYFVEQNRGSQGLLDIELSEPSKSTYSVSYVQGFLNAITPLSDLFTLHFATDMPMEMSCHLLGKIPMKFWLAPRIECE